MDKSRHLPPGAATCHLRMPAANYPVSTRPPMADAMSSRPYPKQKSHPGGQHVVLSLPVNYRETPKRKTSFCEYASPGRRMPLG